MRASQDSGVVARLAVKAGSDVVLRPRPKDLDLEAGTARRVGWSLSAKEGRSLRQALRDGKLKARFRARVTHSAASIGPRVKAVSVVHP
jgi:hypothetical protein